MSNILDIQVPQWGTVSVSQFLLSNVSATVLSNSLLNSQFSNTFAVIGTDMYLHAQTQNSKVATLSNSPYPITDLSGRTWNVLFNVYPPPMTVSGGTLYRQRTEELPVTITPNRTQPGTVTTVSSGYSKVDFSANVGSNIGNFACNVRISPVLPTGLTQGVVGEVGQITGTPTAIRTPVVYTQQAQDPSGRLLSQAFTLSVEKPQISYSNLSGFQPLTFPQTLLNTLSLNLNVPNELSLSMNPAPSSFRITTLPVGMTSSVVGDTVTLTGTPTTYPTGGFQDTTVVNSNALQSSNTTMRFHFADAVYITGPTQLSKYSNVPFSNTQNAQVYTQISGATLRWTLTGNPSNISLSTLTGTSTILGGITDTDAVLQLTATLSQNVDVSWSTTINLTAVPDVVRFSNPPLSIPLYTEQQQNSSNQFTATADSGEPVTYSESTPGTLGAYQLQLDPTTGIIEGTPEVATNTVQVGIVATTPQNASNSLNLSFNVISNTLNFDPSFNLTYFSPTFIQGRDIALDYSDLSRTFRATTVLGNRAQQYVTDDLSGTNLKIQGSVLVGTPLSASTRTVTVEAQQSTITNTVSQTQTILPDQLIFETPTQTDFVIATGTSSNQTIQAHTQSGRLISNWTLSGTVDGVAISSDGVLTLSGTTAGGPTPFTVVANLFAGQSLSRNCTQTVNTGAVFVSPAATSAILPSNAYIEVYTEPLESVDDVFTSITDYAYVEYDSRVYRFTNLSASVYPPVLVTFQQNSNLKFPLRVATTAVTAFLPNRPSTNWIQQVNIDPITISGSSPTGSRMYFTCPNPPQGLVWDPIDLVLTGSPSNSTLGDTFTFQGTDGFTTTALTVAYNVRVPQYLRGFSSPAGYTQQVRQRAIVNGAVHAQNRTAYLPEPLIASEGGAQPPDVIKPDQACVDGIVYQF